MKFSRLQILNILKLIIKTILIILKDKFIKLKVLKTKIYNNRIIMTMVNIIFKDKMIILLKIKKYTKRILKKIIIQNKMFTENKVLKIIMFDNYKIIIMIHKFINQRTLIII